MTIDSESQSKMIIIFFYYKIWKNLVIIKYSYWSISNTFGAVFCCEPLIVITNVSSLSDINLLSLLVFNSNVSSWIVSHNTLLLAISCSNFPVINKVNKI
jgi:hypothetical protein